MTVRHKALGRTRGAFTATTLYIRGDVVRNAGALYAAKNTFTSGATFSAADWDEVLAAPVIPVAAVPDKETTYGPGLPSLFDRKNGDQHINSTNGVEYVHTGVKGAGVEDDFNRADNGAGGLGTTSVGGAAWDYSEGDYCWGIKDNKAFSKSYNSQAASIPLSVGDTTTSVTAKREKGGTFYSSVFCRASSVGSWTDGYHITIESWFSGDKISCFRNGTQIATQSWGNRPAGAGTPTWAERWSAGIRLEIEIVGSVITYKADGFVLHSFTDSTPRTGTRAGFAHGADASGGGGFSYWGESASFENFFGAALGSLKWEKANGVVESHTHAGRVGSAPLVTHAAGLPTLAGRAVNDLHLDTTTGRGHQVTGVYGTGDVADTFTTPATGSVIGRTSEVGGKVYTGSGTLPVQSGEVGPTVAGGGGFGFTASGGNFDFEIKHRNTDANFITPEMHANGYTARFDNNLVALNRSGTQVAVNSDISGYARFAQKTWRMRRTGQLIEVWVDGVLAISYTDTSPLTDTYFGVSIGTNGSYWDDLNFSDTGSAAWTSTEPIYLQAQLASGAVATGTHVLKPGIRVPVASTLKEVVLRCDTAPVGGPITVAVERFNNGVSAGVIATVSIPDGQTVGSVVGLVQPCAKGDLLKFNITAVGSTTAGSDLTVSLDLR